jgi:4'-phosphopantetheinyl transferase
MDVSPLRDAAEFRDALARLPAPRREKVLRYKTARRAAQSLACELLLRDMLADWGIAPVPEIAAGERGRPHFPSRPELSFSFAHSADLAVCALRRDGVIGVDIERVRPVRPRVAERFFTPEERAEIDASADTAAFFRVWTRRESVFKAFGDTDKIKKTSPPNAKRQVDGAPRAYHIETFAPAEGYVLTVCFT